jgi:hypothetical protein
MRPDAPVFKGYVAREGKLIPWYEADTSRDGSIKNSAASRAEQRWFTRLHDDLPEVKPRTPQERLKEMTDTLVSTGVRHGDGSWSFPRSVTRKIQEHAATHGEFFTEQQIVDYAARLLEEAERKNKRTRPEVTLGNS